MNKPPVLSDEEILEAIESASKPCPMEFKDEPKIRAVAQAQRDADIEWFKQAGWVQLAKDQGLPNESIQPTSSVPQSLILSMTSYARRIQHNMVEAGFRKVEIDCFFFRGKE